MPLSVSPRQWRSDYLIHVPTLWDDNYVDLIAESGAEVTVDGAPVGSWLPIADTGYAVAHVRLSNAGNGNHTIAGDRRVGVAVSVKGRANGSGSGHPIGSGRSESARRG